MDTVKEVQVPPGNRFQRKGPSSNTSCKNIHFPMSIYTLTLVCWKRKFREAKADFLAVAIGRQTCMWSGTLALKSERDRQTYAQVRF